MLTIQNILTGGKKRERKQPLLFSSLPLLKIFSLANPFLQGNTKCTTNKYKVQIPQVFPLPQHVYRDKSGENEHKGNRKWGNWKVTLPNKHQGLHGSLCRGDKRHRLHDTVGVCSGCTVLFELKVFHNTSYCRATLLATPWSVTSQKFSPSIIWDAKLWVQWYTLLWLRTKWSQMIISSM